MFSRSSSSSGRASPHSASFRSQTVQEEDGPVIRYSSYRNSWYFSSLTAAAIPARCYTRPVWKTLSNQHLLLPRRRPNPVPSPWYPPAAAAPPQGVALVRRWVARWSSASFSWSRCSSTWRRNPSAVRPTALPALGDNIGVIDIDGEILSADTVVDQLRKFNQNDSIKAIILHIDSPGGGAAASQEIYHEVLRIREQKKKPIVASIESVGASGAYYIASATDKIYANDASVVGSIGVIMEWTNYGNLMQWAKLSPEVIHAGSLKDAGDPSRPMTPQERAYFQSLVDNMYGQFVHDVAEGRHLPAATGALAGDRAGLDRRAGIAAASD